MYVLLVAGCVTLNAAGVAYLLARADLSLRRKVLFTAAAFASVALKMILATQGHNYDLDSYGIVASLVLQGKSVYANTARYNYAPLWACLLAGLKQASICLPSLGQETFHVTVAAFLAVTDVAIAALLASAYSYAGALFFLCSPIVTLLTGYHSQFENLALLVGLVSWLLIRDGTVTLRRVAMAGLLEGVSLALKHLLFLFPIWVLLWPRLGCIRKRFAYAAIAYGLFALSFSPWATDPLSRAGILQNVFRYRTKFQWSLARLIVVGHPFSAMSPRGSTFLTLAWMVALIALGIVVARSKSEPFPMYLLGMFALSPGLADQYLAIPTLACAVLCSSWPAWALAGAGTVALLSSWDGLLHLRLNMVYIAFMPATQICALLLLMVQLRPSTASRETLVCAPGAAMRATVLAFGSAAVGLALVLVRP